MEVQKGDRVRIKMSGLPFTPGKSYEVIDQSDFQEGGIIVIDDKGGRHYLSSENYEVLPKWGDPVDVRDQDSDEWTQAVFVGKDPMSDGFIVMIRDDREPVWFPKCKLRTTVTKQEIADWINVPVELLNIES